MRYFKMMLAAAAITLLPFLANAQTATTGSYFYIGASAGMTVLDSTVTVGRDKLVDQGADGVRLAAHLGYVYAFTGGLRLGAEVEGFWTNLDSKYNPQGQRYRFEVSGGAGLYARVGWAPGGGRSELYALGGVQLLDTNRGWRTAPTVGLGADIAITDRVSVGPRLTYGWDDRREFYTGTVVVSYRF